MIAKVIVDVPAKNVDFTFDYLIPERLAPIIQVGVRVIVPLDPERFKGMSWKLLRKQIQS